MADDRLERLDYYTLLGLEREAPEAEVRAAFQRFALKYHPDRFAGAPADKEQRAAQIFRRGSEGFQVLVDPLARRRYDELLNKGILRMTADQREQASRGPIKSTKAKAKELALRSPQAKAFYERALEAIRAEDWATAWQALRQAAEYEPGNFVIEARLEQVAARIR